MTSTERANWTIAYRKRTANRFLRVSTWSGTWSQAHGMARLFGQAHPELDVYYTSDRSAEVEGFVIEEDVRNILVDSGRRVRIVETDVELPAEMIARIPSAEVARERWNDGIEIPEPEGVTPAPAADFVPLEQVAAGQGFEVVKGTGVVRSFELRNATTGRRVNVFRTAADARKWLAANRAPEMLAMLSAACDGPEQVRAWWLRHGLDKLPSITAVEVLAARAADWDEALAEQRARAAEALLAS